MSADPGASRPAGLVRTALNLLGGTRVAVVGRSMEPTLIEGDRLLIRRLWRRLGPIERGQIVLLRGHAGTNPECIKRIAGLPHERVRIAAGRVFANGRELAEPYLAGDSEAGRPLLEKLLAGEPERDWQLGAGEYLVLGDNRLHSSDSRAYGPVGPREIIGVAWYRYAPPGRRGLVERQ